MSMRQRELASAMLNARRALRECDRRSGFTNEDRLNAAAARGDLRTVLASVAFECGDEWANLTGAERAACRRIPGVRRKVASLNARLTRSCGLR